MARFFALAICVAAQTPESNTYWPESQVGPWGYRISFAKVEAKTCTSGLESPLEIAFMNVTSRWFVGTAGSESVSANWVTGPMNLHQCYHKCSSSSACSARTSPRTAEITDRNGAENSNYRVPCHCDGKQIGDTETVFSICGDERLCKQLCYDSKECYGIHMHRSEPRCFLAKSGCQDEILHGLLQDASGENNYDFIAKIDPETTAGEDACPMGVAVLASHLEDAPGTCMGEINDQYNQVEGAARYSTGCADVQWSTDGCGWLVTVPKPDAPPPAPVLQENECESSAQCFNKVDAANHIFGFSGADEDPAICTRTEPWLSNGYCSNELWKALCPEMCDACPACLSWTNDNEPAATIIAEMLELSPGSSACSVLKGFDLCGDIVVGVVCPSTCSMNDRRLSQKDKPLAAHLLSARSKYGERFQRSLAAIEASLRSTGRHLMSSDRVAIYGSWDPTHRPERCIDTAISATMPVDESIISDTREWYDFYSWRYETVPITVLQQCPDQEIYKTIPNQYCPNNNLDIAGMNEFSPGIEEDLCWKKCLDQAGTDCDGMDASFNAFSNALCLERDQCEEHCTQLGSRCGGIEMHRTLPRCYLIRSSACNDPVMSQEYDQAPKRFGKIRFRTRTTQQCQIDAVKGPVVSGTRESCEDICAADPSCSGFNMDLSIGECEFFNVPDPFVAGDHCSAGVYNYGGLATVNTLVASSRDKVFIEKSSEAGVSTVEPWSPPCVPQIDGAELADEIGLYTRRSSDHEDCAGQSEVCYVSPGKTYRYVWAQQNTFDESEIGLDRRCKGWILQMLNEDGAYVSRFMSFADRECDQEHGDNLLTDVSGMYLWAPEQYQPASLTHVCKSYPTCSTLHTCVLAKNRFANELALQLRKGGVDAFGVHWLGDMTHEGRSVLLDSTIFQPKILVSVERAVAFVSEAKIQWSQGYINRNVPGHFQIRVETLGARRSKAVITMVSAHEVESDRELGVQLGDPPSGYEPWLTDLMKIERFIETLAPVDADSPAAYIDFYAPNAPQLVVYYFPKTGRVDNPSQVPVQKLAHYPGWFRVTVKANGYYVGTTESPCPPRPAQVLTDPNMVQMTCPVTDAGATCKVPCKSGMTADFVCVRGQWSDASCPSTGTYREETMLFRLSHRSRLDYGWRIRKVRLYSDETCSDSSRILGRYISIQDPDWYTVNQNKQYKPDSLFTDAVLGPETRCVTTPSSCSDWWSMGLNVNPYAVDETHSEAVSLDFRVELTAPIQAVKCVQVVSRSLGPDGDRQYYPSSMSLHRGWSVNERKEDGAELKDSILSIDGWTEMWLATADESERTAEGLVTTFKSTCGKTGTRTYGELLGESYEVPSSCHCKQLCIDMASRGCRSWNYRDKPATRGECFLLASVKDAPPGSCESDAEWTSGDTGVRITGHEPAQVTPGAAFDLELSGYNLPWDGSKTRETTGSRQRVKIVPLGPDNERPTACAESKVAEQVEGIGCSHPYFCAPRPSDFDSTSVAWHGLKIHSSIAESTYRVCYNSGFTYDRYQWNELGLITVREATYVWEVEPAILQRTTPLFDIKVIAQDAFSLSDAVDWQLKLVRVHFSCDVALDPKFNLTVSPQDTTAASAQWSMVSLYNEGTETFADVGEYKVCFRDAGAGIFREIPGFNGRRYLEILADDSYSTHARDIFWSQKLSGKVNHTSDFKLAGHRLFLPSTSKISFWKGGCVIGTYTNVSAALDEDLSSADSYVFTGTVGNLEPGTYDVCYCDSQLDASLAGNATSTYSVQEDRVCGATDDGEGQHSNTMTLADLGPAHQQQLCTIKCSRGCVGPDCYCGAFDHDTMYVADTVAGLDNTRSYPICASALGCRDACEAHASNCTGYDYDPARNLCWLLDGMVSCGAGSAGFKEGRELWTRAQGEACIELADFSTEVGEVAITARADVDGFWVLTPGEVASVEVLGSNLDWKTDRIMLIDCTGVCGVSGPTESSTGVAQTLKQSNHWLAEHVFKDAPGMLASADESSEEDVAIVWEKKEGQYCPGNNMDISAHKDQCYSKCVTNSPCVGADCHCSGLLQGYDRADSQALCLPEAECKAVCEDMEDCYGIDMANDSPRCFLNGNDGTCEEYIIDQRLNVLSTYSFSYKQRVPEGRRLEDVDPASRSWDEILRFKGAAFSTGGQFKACFCDRDTLEDGAFCTKKEDYKVEIGTIHVSGVSCLIGESRFQRGTCVEQYYGGLRCYTGAAPMLTIPELPIDGGLAGPGGAAAVTSLSSYCLYGPEEETRDSPLC